MQKVFYCSAKATKDLNSGVCWANFVEHLATIAYSLFVKKVG